MDKGGDLLQQIRAAAKKRYLFLPHALRQMNRPERMISTREIRQVIERGKIIEDYPEDARGHSPRRAERLRFRRMVFELRRNAPQGASALRLLRGYGRSPVAIPSISPPPQSCRAERLRFRRMVLNCGGTPREGASALHPLRGYGRSPAAIPSISLPPQSIG